MASSGNFCTMNQVDTGSYQTIIGGGLIVGSTGSSTADQAKRGATFYVQSGKWYWEVRQTVGGSSYGSVGISVGSAGTETPSANSGFSQGLMYQSIAGTLEAVAAGYVGLGTVTTTSTGVSAVSNNQVINIALDMDNRKLWFGLDGTYFNSGDPANGTNPQIAWTTTPSEFIHLWGDAYQSITQIIANWGQDSTFSGNETAGGNADENGFGDFKYSPPTGFLTVCSANLSISDDIDPAQTDDDFAGGKLFNCITYTGNAGSNAISGLGFKPDFCWIKKRNSTGGAAMVNSTIGGQKVLQSNNSDAEGSSSPFQTFDADGFTLDGTSSYLGNFNGSSDTYVAWCWKVNGGTTASNTSGDINSTTQASDKTGLSIVTYTGNGSQNQSIGHGLTKAPEMVWFKNYSNASVGGIAMDWTVALSTSSGSPFASRSGSAQCLALNTTAAIQAFYRTEGNFTPTTSTFSVPNNGNAPYWFNANANNCVAYCWHSVEGFSKFGFYEGNGNVDGPFIYTGFRPRMIFVKRIDSTASWYVWDTARSTFNKIDDYIEWDTTNAEETGYANQAYDFLSNGFKARGNNNIGNSSGGTYLYGAWGDVPFKYNNTF